MTIRRAVMVPASLALLGGVALVGCGDQGSSDEDASTCDPAAATVTVHALDALEFDAEAYEADAGCVELRYVNDGNVAHTLLVEGYDFELSVGDTDDGRLELEPGTYRLYCDIAGHEKAGMEADLTVG